jgi:putative aldouronate transport system permease protein
MKQLQGGGFSDHLIMFIILLAVLVCLFPMLNVLAVSLSSNNAVMTGRVFLWPVEFDTGSYRVVLADRAMVRSLLFTVQITILHTAISIGMTIACAYPLSKRSLKGRGIFTLIIIFTMYFGGGIIPDYLLIKSLGLLNTQWALIIPGAISTFNMIILRTFFTQLPQELEEAAMIDGAGDAFILTRIALPLSLPVLATLSLFYAVGKWNSFQDALFYITRAELYPLQLRLQAIISNALNIDANLEGMEVNEYRIPESLKAASVMFATVPILMVYPWLQRYFVKGVMVGSLKG